jgi:hypothetical protein
MSKQTKYKDLDDVKMAIKRTEVARTRAKFDMLAQKASADRAFAIVNSMEGMALTEAMKAKYHENLKLGELCRKNERKAFRLMGRAEIKLERLKKLAGEAATPTFEFMGGDCGVVG